MPAFLSHLTSAFQTPEPAGSGVARWDRRETLFVCLAVLVFWTTAALIWPLTDTVVPWDSKNHFYPMLRYLGTALEHGELPLWNPYHFGGHPSVADPQSLLFTPTMLLFGWLDPSPSMRVFDAVVFAHFLPGALGVVALFRRRGWHPAGAVLAAMIFMLGGSASARLQHTGMIISYGFFPLALWLLEEALDRRSYRTGALFAVIAAMMTVGRDQVAFLCGLTLVALVVQRTWSAPDRVAYLRQRLGLLAAMGAIGGALLAIPSLLTMQFLMTSTRPSFGFGVAAMGSLPPESLSTLLFGNVFGSLRWTYDYWGPGWPTLPEGTWTDRAINYLFAGTIPALLLLWHGIAGGRLFAREFRFFLAVLGFSLVYALGRYTPLFSLIFDHVPGIALYRRPADATFLVNVAFAMASGYLLHRYLLEGGPRPGPFRSAWLRAALPVAAILMVAAAVTGALAFAVRGAMIGPAVLEVGIGSAIAITAAVVLVRSSRSAGARLVAASAALLLTGSELIWRNAASPLNAEPTARYAVYQQLPPEQLQGLQVLKRELAERNANGERPRVEILGLGGAWQNASMVLGLEDTIGYNPLRLAGYERAVGPGENAADPNLRQFPSLFRGYRCRLAGLLGLEYLVLDRPADRLPRHFPRLTEAKLLYGSGTMWVYRLNSGAPRAYLASRLVPVDSEAVLEQDELPDFDRTRTALVDSASLPLIKKVDATADTTSEPEPAQGSVSIRYYRRNAVTLDVDTDRPSVVVLHDLYYPGWEATVDGKVQPILRTNLLFRGVEVPAGQHTVEFRFRPLSVGNLVAAASELMTRDGDEGGETTVQ